MMQCLWFLVVCSVVKSVLSAFPYGVSSVPASNQKPLTEDEYQQYKANMMRSLSKSPSMGSGRGAPKQAYTAEEYHKLMQSQYGGFPNMVYKHDIGGVTFRGRVGDEHPFPESGLPFRGYRRSYSYPTSNTNPSGANQGYPPRSNSFQQTQESTRNSRVTNSPTMGNAQPYSPPVAAPPPPTRAETMGAQQPLPSRYDAASNRRPTSQWTQDYGRPTEPTRDSRPATPSYEAPAATPPRVPVPVVSPPRVPLPVASLPRVTAPVAQPPQDQGYNRGNSYNQPSYNQKPQSGDNGLTDSPIGSLLGGNGNVVKGGTAQDEGGFGGMDGLFGGGQQRQDDAPKALPVFNPQGGRQAAADFAHAVIGEIENELKATRRLNVDTDSVLAYCEKTVEKQRNCMTEMKKADPSLIDILQMIKKQFSVELEVFLKKYTQAPFTCIEGSDEMKSYTTVITECVRPVLVLMQV